VPYSLSEPSIFRANELKPVKDLKLLIRDHPVCARFSIVLAVSQDSDIDVESSRTCPDDTTELVRGQRNSRMFIRG